MSAAGQTRPADGVWPLDPEPEVVRAFEPPPGPYAPGHRGVDLAGQPGQAVRAALPGTVGFAGSIGGKPVVTVLHGGRRTTYEPVVASVEPRPGGRRRRRARPTHDHRQPLLPRGLPALGPDQGAGEDYLDPLTLVGSGPVRLLPLWRDVPATVRLAWTPPWTAGGGPLDALP